MLSQWRGFTLIFRGFTEVSKYRAECYLKAFTTKKPALLLPRGRAAPARDLATENPLLRGGIGAGPAAVLDVVIQGELVRMRPQAHGIRFVLALVVDVGFDQFRAEYIALQQEAVVVFQAVERFVERCRHRRHRLHLLRRQIVDVLVQRLARVDL